MAEVICEAECPACGSAIELTKIGYTPCPCGEAVAELTVLWEIIEDTDGKENE